MPSVPLLLYTSLPNQCAVAKDGGRLDPCRSTPAPLRTGRPPPGEGRSYTITLRPLLQFLAADRSFPVWIGGVSHLSVFPRAELARGAQARVQALLGNSPGVCAPSISARTSTLGR
eukprot:scaffold417_cov101-Isochrysis_galbana.AAC.2